MYNIFDAGFQCNVVSNPWTFYVFLVRHSALLSNCFVMPFRVLKWTHLFIHVFYECGSFVCLYQKRASDPMGLQL